MLWFCFLWQCNGRITGHSTHEWTADWQQKIEGSIEALQNRLQAILTAAMLCCSAPCPVLPAVRITVSTSFSHLRSTSHAYVRMYTYVSHAAMWLSTLCWSYVCVTQPTTSNTNPNTYVLHNNINLLVLSPNTNLCKL